MESLMLLYCLMLIAIVFQILCYAKTKNGRMLLKISQLLSIIISASTTTCLKANAICDFRVLTKRTEVTGVGVIATIVFILLFIGTEVFKTNNARWRSVLA